MFWWGVFFSLSFLCVGRVRNFEICVESFEQIFLFLNMTDMYRDYWGDYYTRSQNAFSLSLSLWLRRRFIVVVLLYRGLFLSLIVIIIIII